MNIRGLATLSYPDVKVTQDSFHYLVLTDLNYIAQARPELVAFMLRLLMKAESAYCIQVTWGLPYSTQELQSKLGDKGGGEALASLRDP